MATVSAGNIDLTVSTTGDFGHHVATQQSVNHTTEYRKPVGYPYGNAGTSHPDNTAGILDFNQWGVTHYYDYTQLNYHDSDYITLDRSDYDWDANLDEETFDEWRQNRTFDPNYHNTNQGLKFYNPDSTSNQTLAFDFSDYVGLSNCDITFTATLDNQSVSPAYVVFQNAYTSNQINGGEGNISVSTTSGTFLIPNSGIVKVLVRTVSGTGATYLKNPRISISGQGVSLLNITPTRSHTFTQTNNLVGTGTAAYYDTEVTFNQWSTASIPTIEGNLSLYGMVASAGLHDITDTGAGLSYVQMGGSAHQLNTGWTADGINYDPSLNILDANGTLLESSPLTNDTARMIGTSGQDDSGLGTNSNKTANVNNVPHIVTTFVKNDSGNITVSEAANLSLQLKYIAPSRGILVPGGNSYYTDYDSGFVSARLLMKLPLTSGPVSLDNAFDIDTLAGLVIPTSKQLDTTFTSNFLGGIVIDSDTVQQDVVTTFTSENTGTGVVIDNTISLNSSFTQTATANPLKGVANIDIAVSWFKTTEPGVIIAGPIDLVATSISLSADATVILQSATVDETVSFTSNFLGGIVRESGAVQSDIAFATAADPTRLTPAITRNLNVQFNPPTAVDKYKFHHDVYDEFNNPIAPGNFVTRISEYPDIDIAFEQTATANPLLISTANLVHQFTESALVTVIPGPIDYFTIELENITRTADAHSDRTFKIDTETRQITAYSNRTIALNTESRQFKAK